MAYKAVIGFCGVVSMAAGEVREIPDPAVAADLLKAGYIVEIKDETVPRKKKAPKGG